MLKLCHPVFLGSPTKFIYSHSNVVPKLRLLHTFYCQSSTCCLLTGWILWQTTCQRPIKLFWWNIAAIMCDKYDRPSLANGNLLFTDKWAQWWKGSGDKWPWILSGNTTPTPWSISLLIKSLTAINVCVCVLDVAA